MAVLWPLSRTRETDDNGRPLGGAKAYFFDADTTTPRVVYQDGSLSTPHTHPVVADGFGRWPAVFLPAGEFRVRVTTAAGVTLFDDDNIDPTTEVEGGDDSVPADSLKKTGDVFARFQTGVEPGAVRLNGRTIGSGASGASERANDDCEDLYIYLWNNVADRYAPVSGGRGSTAAADWQANKPLALPDARGKALFGLDDMGNSAAGLIQVSTTIDTTDGSTSATVASATGLALGMEIVADNIPAGTTIAGISGTTITLSANATATASGTAVRFSFLGDAQEPGSTGGAQSHTLTPDEMPSHTHSVSGSTGTAGAHSHAVGDAVLGGQPAGAGMRAYTGVNPAYSTTDGAHSHSVSGTAAEAGGDGSHNNMPPGIAVTWYIQL